MEDEMREIESDGVEVDGLNEESPAYQAVVNFEDLMAWQQARILSAQIHQLTREIIRQGDRSFADQMRRASVSTLSNIAEGYERASLQEFHRFLSIAKGSCGELRAQLYIALDAGYIDQDTFQRCSLQARRTSQLIGGLRSSVARRLAAQRPSKPK